MYLQQHHTFATDIIGKPCIARYVNMDSSPGLQPMHLVYRVTNVENLDKIWNMYEDQTLDQRLTWAVRRTNFAQQIGLDPLKLHVELTIDQKQFYLAKSELIPPVTHSRRRHVRKTTSLR